MLKIDRFVWRLVDAVILLSILSLVTLIALQVGSRMLNHSVSWTEELSRFLFVWVIWLGLAASFRNGHHPSLNLFSNMVPDSAIARIMVRGLPAFSAFVLFSIVAWHGWSLMQQQIRFGEQSATLSVGMWLMTLPLVLGSGLSILGTMTHMVASSDDDTVILFSSSDGAEEQEK